jgi:uncharacterized protein
MVSEFQWLLDLSTGSLYVPYGDSTDDMRKYTHETRDPVHAFIRMDSDERLVLDSRPFQRLRHIHQLALTWLVYPGATHKRFEHSLGVMELAGRVYDVITDQENIFEGAVRQIIPKFDSDEHRYWRRVLRMAALCHDIGHLPFSHAAEHELLPPGTSHEDLTINLIRSDEMRGIWSSMRPPLSIDDIIKLAVGKKFLKNHSFSLWEAILSEIIVGNVFGVDRMDYLLRDSLHSGVGYGRFDHFRLIDTIRMLPRGTNPEVGEEPVLGIEEGGIHAAEALLVARYFMFSQVYFHPIRRIYDHHLKEFMLSKFGSHGYPTAIEDHLTLDDVRILSDISLAANDQSHTGHSEALRIQNRRHFRRVYSADPGHLRVNPEAARYVADWLKGELGVTNVVYDNVPGKSSAQSFPVLTRDGRIVDSTLFSEVFSKGLKNPVDFVFCNPDMREKAEKLLKNNIDIIIQPKGEV